MAKSFRIAGCGDPFGSGHRQERESGYKHSFCRGPRSTVDARARRRRHRCAHPPYRPLPGQSKAPDKNLCTLAGGAWRRSSLLTRGTGDPPRGRPQDCECCVEHSLWRLERCCRYTHFSSRQPHWTCTRKNAPGGGAQVAPHDSAPLSQRRSPLDDSSRALRLQSKKARLPCLWHSRALRLSVKDAQSS